MVNRMDNWFELPMAIQVPSAYVPSSLSSYSVQGEKAIQSSSQIFPIQKTGSITYSYHGQCSVIWPVQVPYMYIGRRIPAWGKRRGH